MLRYGLVLMIGVCSTRAQPTQWIVDQQGRPGTQFREVQPAIQAARAGDIITVRQPATGAHYASFTVDRGITVRSERWSSRGVPVDTPITIQGIPRSERAVVDGFSNGDPISSIGVQDCAGDVVVTNCSISNLIVQNARSALFRECRAFGYDHSFENATVTLSRCHLTGSGDTWTLYMLGGTVLMESTWIDSNAPPFGTGSAIAGWGDVWVLGDSNVGWSSSSQGASFDNFQGSIFLASNATLMTPALSGTVRPLGRQPVLTGANRLQRGATSSLQIREAPNAIVTLNFGGASGYLTAPFLEVPLLIDPATIVFVAAKTTAADGTTSFDVSIPTAAALSGQLATFFSVSLPTSGRLTLTLPFPVVVD